MLFSTPLRTGAGGRLRPGLCTSWRTRRHEPGACAAATRTRSRRSFGARRDWPGEVARPAEHAVVVTTETPAFPIFRYLLTAVAGPRRPACPGPFRLISASPRRVVAERNGPAARRPQARSRSRRCSSSARASSTRRRCRSATSARRSSTRSLRRRVRVRRLLAADAVVFSHRVPPEAAPASTTTPPTGPTTRRSCPSSRRRRPRASPSTGSRAPRRPRSRCADAQEAHPGPAAAGPSASRSRADPTLAYGSEPAGRSLARPRPRRGRRRRHGRGAASGSPPRTRAARALTALCAGQARRPDRLGRRRAARLAAPARLARGRARLGRLRAGSELRGHEPTPVTSKRAVAIAGASTPGRVALVVEVALVDEQRLAGQAGQRRPSSSRHRRR